MRIPQEQLAGKTPAASYERVVNGRWARVDVYSSPKCVNIVTDNSRHCYPVTQTGYLHYIMEAEEWNNPNVSFAWSMISWCMYQAKQHPDLETFFRNAAKGYANRIQKEAKEW